jgi:hypothetical protein
VPEISGQFFGNEKKFDVLLSAWTGRPDPAMTYGLMYAKDAYFNAGRVEVSHHHPGLFNASGTDWEQPIRKREPRFESALAVPFDDLLKVGYRRREINRYSGIRSTGVTAPGPQQPAVTPTLFSPRPGQGGVRAPWRHRLCGGQPERAGQAAW